MVGEGAGGHDDAHAALKAESGRGVLGARRCACPRAQLTTLTTTTNSDNNNNNNKQQLHGTALTKDGEDYEVFLQERVRSPARENVRCVAPHVVLLVPEDGHDDGNSGCIAAAAVAAGCCTILMMTISRLWRRWVVVP
jgi:hypothetical protein